MLHLGRFFICALGFSVLVILPSKTELKFFKQLSAGWHRDGGFYKAQEDQKKGPLTLFHCGVGRDEIVETLSQNKARLLEYDLIVLSGLCGSLTEKIQRGTVVSANEVILGSDPARKRELLPINSNSILQVRLCTSLSLVERPEQKKELFEVTQAEVVDMEAWHMLEVLPHKTIKVLKVVLDESTESMRFLVTDKGRQLEDAKLWKKKASEVLPRLFPYIQEMRK